MAVRVGQLGSLSRIAIALNQLVVWLHLGGRGAFRIPLLTSDKAASKTIITVSVASDESRSGGSGGLGDCNRGCRASAVGLVVWRSRGHCRQIALNQ